MDTTLDLIRQYFPVEGIPTGKPFARAKRALKKVLRANGHQLEVMRGVGFSLPEQGRFFTYRIQDGLVFLDFEQLDAQDLSNLHTEQLPMTNKLVKKPKPDDLSNVGWAHEVVRTLNASPIIPEKDEVLYGWSQNGPIQVIALMISTLRARHVTTEKAVARLKSAYPDRIWTCSSQLIFGAHHVETEA